MCLFNTSTYLCGHPVMVSEFRDHPDYKSGRRQSKPTSKGGKVCKTSLFPCSDTPCRGMHSIKTVVKFWYCGGCQGAEDEEEDEGEDEGEDEEEDEEEKKYADGEKSEDVETGEVEEVEMEKTEIVKVEKMKEADEAEGRWLKLTSERRHLIPEPIKKELESEKSVEQMKSAGNHREYLRLL